jgi:ankyrin repeat protein
MSLQLRLTFFANFVVAIAAVFFVVLLFLEARPTSPQEREGAIVLKEPLDQAGRSQLHYAARDGNLVQANQLIRAGANVNMKDANGYTPLHFAAQGQKLEVAKLLVKAGAEVDAKDKHGNSPLNKAVFHYTDTGDLIQFLRANGADPNEQNNYGVSPVALARQIANYDVAKFFDDLP